MELSQLSRDVFGLKIWIIKMCLHGFTVLTSRSIHISRFEIFEIRIIIEKNDCL